MRSRNPHRSESGPSVNPVLPIAGPGNGTASVPYLRTFAFRAFAPFRAFAFQAFALQTFRVTFRPKFRSNQEVYNLLCAPAPRVEVDVRLVETSNLGLTTLGFSSAAPVGAVLFCPEELAATASPKLSELIQQGEAKVLADPRISSFNGENVAVRIGGERAPKGHAAPEVEVEVVSTALDARHIPLDLKIQITETRPEGTGEERGRPGNPRITKTAVLMTDRNTALLNSWPLQQLTEGGAPVSCPLVVVLTGRVAKAP